MNEPSDNNEENQFDVTRSIPLTLNEDTEKKSNNKESVILSGRSSEKQVLTPKYFTYLLSTGLMGSILLFLTSLLVDHFNDMGVLISYTWLTQITSVTLLSITCDLWLKPIRLEPVQDLTLGVSYNYLKDE